MLLALVSRMVSNDQLPTAIQDCDLPIALISGCPDCTKYANRPCHILVQRLTQTVPRSRRSPRLLPPTRNSIPEIVSRFGQLRKADGGVRHS